MELMGWMSRSAGGASEQGAGRQPVAVTAIQDLIAIHPHAGRSSPAPKA